MEITRNEPGTPTLKWILAAAILIMLAAAGYLLRENLVMRDRFTQLQNERDQLQQHEQELQKQLANQKAADAETQKELTQLREKLSQVQRQLNSLNSRELDTRDLKLVALNLSPQTRGIGKAQILSLPPQSEYVAITLQLQTIDFSEYQVALKSVDAGNTLWQSSRLAPAGKAVQFGMPAKVLKEENYIFELSGLSGASGSEVITGYPFRVVKQ